ncbi:hypothetical protein QVZ41_14230 [Wenyingzhuangia sp. chi5]|uniref:Uncharacterized protein n=1 Tax=Wenyingzhuangia gilva TaxID=3057677 RepID=A0ABT8VVK4_9FLAO|nr:hypothetical protein [Wenyingzhuangia sp. chi5]MDO3696006.1 hypothetical protein [Wenyingzhuangia sp. chi5]
MKIEKVKNYNQKLLAILVTIGVIFLIIALISFIFMAIQESRRYNYNEPETGILSEEKIKELQKENKRKQVISYESPILIDTLNLNYIIPVSHKTLNETEDITGLLSAFPSSDSEISKKKDNRYSRSVYGIFNNIILYDGKKGTNNKLFNGRLNFEKIDTEYFEDEILVLIKASGKDTFKDGVINLKDFSSLYIYSLKEEKMRKIEVSGMDVFHFNFIEKTKDLIIEFGVDKNKDGFYESYNEPIVIKKYDFKNEKLVDIIDTKINSELQKSLEGTEK